GDGTGKSMIGQSSQRPFNFPILPAARTGGLPATARACGVGCAGRPQHGVGAVVSGKGRLMFLYSSCSGTACPARGVRRMITTPPFMKGPDGVGPVPVRGNNRIADLHDGARSLHANDRPRAHDVPVSSLSAAGPALGDPGEQL